MATPVAAVLWHHPVWRRSRVHQGARPRGRCRARPVAVPASRGQAARPLPSALRPRSLAQCRLEPLVGHDEALWRCSITCCPLAASPPARRAPARWCGVDEGAAGAALCPLAGCLDINDGKAKGARERQVLDGLAANQHWPPTHRQTLPQVGVPGNARPGAARQVPVSRVSHD